MSMSGTQSTTITASEISVARPNMYSVVVLNDNFTPMDFVTILLMQIFGMDLPKAEQLMLQIHQQGKGIAGVFTREIAEVKAQMANEWAKEEGHPLLCQVSVNK